MPRVRDLLYRFRPAGAPGAAGPAGVPADRGAESAAELEPLFAQLAGTEQECARLLEAARREAQEIRAHGQQEAQAVTATAAQQAEKERAAAAARLTRHGDSAAEAERQAAEAAVATLQRRAAETVPAYVDAVVDHAAALIGGSAGARATRDDAR